MAKIEEIHLTVHASQRGIQRDVSEAEIHDVVKTGSRRKEDGPGEQGGVIWQFSKIVRGRSIIVVGEVLQKKCYVLTVKPGKF